MLNFNDLTCVVSESYSFVGIVKADNQLCLHLPKGFQEHLAALNTFEKKRDLFFLLYRVLRQFKSICTEKGYLETHSKMVTRDRDGIVQGDAGSTIATNLDESLIFYSKLDSVGALLDAYDELKIAALGYRLGRTDRIDLSQIHRYLDRGIFLPNGAVYVDAMVLPRQQVQFETTDIVALYCYLVREVQIQLRDDVSPEVGALAERFRQHYLGTEDSLFAEQSFERVVNILKEALDTIDQRTPLKDGDYDQFYDAIEQFLYGNWQRAEDGEIWGINNFHSVWESICLTHLAQTVPAQSVVSLDRTFVSEYVLQTLDATPKLLDLTNTFICNNKRLVPDAVIFPAILISTQVNTEYLLSEASPWNDYGYCTRLWCNSSNFAETINVAYVGQPGNHHTIEELNPLYSIDEESRYRLLIDNPLPKQFYSYWSINLDSSSEEFGYYWHAMQYFNHIFYVVIQQGLWTTKEFLQWLFTKLDVSDRGRGNVFQNSLFRDRNLSSIKEEFNAFVSYLLQFDVIDIKYMSLDYLQNSTNINSLKERSIRKQFVYEHLLQEQIKTLTPEASPTITSQFWIPAVKPNQPVLSDAPTYLDGNLKLVNVNLPDVLEKYITAAT